MYIIILENIYAKIHEHSTYDVSSKKPQEKLKKINPRSSPSEPMETVFATS